MTIKLISFDFDGVIVHGFNTWFKIRELRNIPEGRYLDFQNGLIDGLEFRNSEHVLYKQVKLCKKDFEDVANILELSPHVKEVITELKNQGYILAINSAGPKLSIQTKLEREGINFFKYICSMIPLFDANGFFYDTSVPYLDEIKMFDKLKALELISKKESIPLKEMVHVGDGVNDIKAFEKSIGISYNPQNKRVIESAKYNIDDLKDLIPLLKKLR
ncbi:MAG: HAD family hydrolase [Candidatus Lokiarchaeota archaeon]|nr:HAD family hydrolase [Candidatus Lokiarchaeota archaeon]